MYLPLDKDIVREMWVQGDLKDQLGLSHRKVRKGKNISVSNLEAAPMFTNIHGRSLSDLTNYEPALADSPPYAASLTGQTTTYLDTPPMDETVELPPREDGVQYVQPTTKPSSLHLSPLTVTPSPQPSYYSASDLPIPSPLPSPKYELPSGEITSIPPSRKPSITASRATSTRGVRSISTLPFPHSLSPGSLSIPPTQTYGKGASAGPGEYEMQTYDENIYDDGSGTSQTSQASFATADDFWAGEEGVSSPDYAYRQHTPMLHTPPPQPDPPSSGPHVALQGDEDDRSTIVADSRRGSVSSWEGGLAL